MNIYDVIVIGGGASGMMAAGRAGELGKSVLLLEKNKNLGEKLKISGGGRCNITNAEEDIRILLKNYGEGEQYLYSPFSEFGIKDTFNFFEKRQLPLVVQARKRAFPHTEKALDVFKVLEKYIKNGLVTVIPNSPVTKINVENGEITSVMCGRTQYVAGHYILATGGVSHPETGSTGDGFKWLSYIGHTVKDPTPTIVPLAVLDNWVKELAGVTLSFMKITFFVNGKKELMKKGKILFTHFGLSGPLILNLAGKVGDMLHAGVVTASIDAYPDTDLGALDKKVMNIFDKNKNKMLKNIIGEVVPEGMSGTLPILLPQINFETKVHSISREERKIITNILKALPVTISGLMGYDRAVVADGGIPLSEIDMKTMKSKKVKNLSVTGDLLNINRPSGGYSLQLCWTTGYIAGSNA
jgi:predicted Rossmann fold flavoprotein